MEEKRMVKRKSAEVDWFDLFMEIVSHWRAILLFLIIGFLVFGCIGFLTTKKDNDDIRVDPVSDIAGKYTADELKKELSPEEITGIEDALYNYRLLTDNEKYISDSPLFQIDAANTPMCKVTLRVVEADTGNGYSIASEYIGIVRSEEIKEYIAKKCGIDGDISKLVNVDECSVDIIGMHFCHPSLEKCEEMADAFIDYMNDKSKLFQKSFKKHQFVVLNKAKSETYVSAITSAQKEAHDASANYRKKIEGYEKVFSLDAIYYFKLRLMEEYGDEQVIKDSGIEYYEVEAKEKLQAEKNGEDQAGGNTKEKEPQSPVKTAVKMGLLGIIVFEFIYVVIIGYRYALSSKVNDVDEISDLYGIKSFGKIYREGKHKTPLDKAISRARRRGRELIPEADAREIIVSNIVNEASEGNVKTVAVLGGEDSVTGKIAEALKANNIETVLLKNPALNVEELNQLTGIESAVILAKPGVTCYGEVWDQLELLANRSIKVLGGALI